jgi:hypothetical protein
VTERLRDSLGDARATIGNEAAMSLRRRCLAKPEAESLAAGDRSALRTLLPEPNPFDALPATGDKDGLHAWWRQHQHEIELTVMIEERLIADAIERYQDTTDTAVYFGGNAADPLVGIRALHGAASADKVQRRAAILASRLSVAAPDEVAVLAQHTAGELDRTGIERAGFELAARHLALTYHEHEVELAHHETDLARHSIRPPPLVPPPTTGKLSDSLETIRVTIGDELAGSIRKRCMTSAAQMSLSDTERGALRQMLPEPNPIDALPIVATPDAVHAWLAANRREFELTVMIEEQLIADAAERYQGDAEHLAIVDGPHANPLTEIVALRGQECADTVARRAAILASELPYVGQTFGTYEVDVRQQRAVAALKEVGIQQADVELLAQTAAFTYHANELMSALVNDKPVERPPVHDVADAQGFET